MSAKLLKNGTVLAFNESQNSIDVLHNSHILIIDGNIAAITEDLEDITVPSDAEIIDVTGKIVSPGFINTHQHMWMTAYRTLGLNITLSSYFHWLNQYTKERDAYAGKDIYISTLAGYCEALNGGVTTLVDHAHNHWTQEVLLGGLKAADDGGARVWWCFHPEKEDQFPYEEQIKVWKDAAARLRSQGSLVSFGLAYDHMAQAQAAQVENVNSLIRDLELEVVTTHYLGGPWPIGGNSPEIANGHGLLDGSIPVIFSHGGFVSAKDIALLREKGHYLSITPESEMHFGHGQKTSHLVLDRASLGIDTNWTFSGDILTQGRMWLQSVRNERYNKTLATGMLPRNSPMTPHQAFMLATRHGGLALRRNDIGVLTGGAKADIVVFNGDSPNMVGWSDPVAAVMLHANVGDIEHVIVNGEFRKRDGKLLTKTSNWEAIKAEFVETAARIQELDKNEPPLPEKFFGTGDFADVERVNLT